MAILDNQDFLKQVQERYSSLESRRESLRQSGSNREIEGPNTFRQALGRDVRSEFGTPHYGAGGQPLNEAARMLSQLDTGRQSGPPEIFSGGPAFMAGTDRREGESQADRFTRLADQFNSRFVQPGDGVQPQSGGQEVVDATGAIDGGTRQPLSASRPTASFTTIDPMGMVSETGAGVEDYGDVFALPNFASEIAGNRPFWSMF